MNALDEFSAPFASFKGEATKRVYSEYTPGAPQGAIGPDRFDLDLRMIDYLGKANQFTEFFTHSDCGQELEMNFAVLRDGDKYRMGGGGKHALGLTGWHFMCQHTIE